MARETKQQFIDRLAREIPESKNWTNWELHTSYFNAIRAEKLLLKLKELGITMTRNNND